jgi:hypothetical protein
LRQDSSLGARGLVSTFSLDRVVKEFLTAS